MLTITAKKDADLVTGDLPCSLCPMGYYRDKASACGEKFREKYGMSCMDKLVTVELKFKKK